jgi:hypothetical protein
VLKNKKVKIPQWLNHSSLLFLDLFKGIVSRDFGVLFLFIWIDMKFLIGPDQVYFSFYRGLPIQILKRVGIVSI